MDTFRDANMSSGIHHSTLNAVFWSALDAFIRLGFQFGITVALARLLTPEEFGIVAILSVFTGIASVFVESGLSAAVVQLRDIEQQEISAVFHFQLIIAVIMGFSLGLISPWIARFYGHAILEPLIWVMALNLFVNALGAVQGSLLSRTLDFRLLTIASLVSTLVSGALAIFLAIKGAGVWALVAQTLVASVVNVGTLWLCHPWRPQMMFRPALLKRPFAFGKYLLLSGLLDAVFGRLYGLFIGKMYGAADLGQYNRAIATQGMPQGVLIGVVTRVTFPVFSALHHDKPRLRAAMRRALLGVMAINIPAMLGLLAVAELLVLTLFGDAWRPSIPVLRIVCLAGLVQPLYGINCQVLIAQGHSRLFFRLEVVKKCLGTVVFLTAVPFGIEALAWSGLAVVIMWFAIHAHYTRRMLDYGALAQMWDCVPWLVAGIFMACAVWILPHLVALSAPASLALQLVLGATLYLSFWVLWDASLLREMLRLVPGQRVKAWLNGGPARI
jgi:teichuronic acid exporter